MGDHFSSSNQGGKSSRSRNSNMQSLVLLLSVVLANTAVSPVKRAADAEPTHFGAHSGPHCHDKKENMCHKKPKQNHHKECHVDYDIVVDVTEIEECEYVVITHCQEDHEQVYHNSHIVGHDSQVVDVHHSAPYAHGGYAGYGGYHKRAAEPGHNHHCEDKKEMQCKKHPHENSRKIPKQTCKKSWIRSILRNARRESSLDVKRLMKGVTTASVLSAMNPRRLLILMDTMTVLLAITRVAC